MRHAHREKNNKFKVNIDEKEREINPIKHHQENKGKSLRPQ